ncbi:MAG: NAD(P)-dependent oxidoreductase [Chloroflexota bacterium]|nr:NAD(P)-dependent oxidoreductase [Chloroflexota bacterium]
MILTGPVAVTGAQGRLGRALVSTLEQHGLDVLAWTRPDYDLDGRGAAKRMLDRDRPAMIIHAAAWTDVDGCARDPAAADRRNGLATAELAEACASAGAGLLYVSTNEVFDGRREDGLGYSESDATGPLNPYGASKLAGERSARTALGQRDGLAGGLWIVRTSWLFGPPGNDFPAKILAARDRLDPDVPLRVVSDEVASPTFARDLARGLVALLERADPGTYHLAGAGQASRLDWATTVLEACGRVEPLEPVPGSTWERASEPPAWGLLDCSRAGALGIRLPLWQPASIDYARSLCSAGSPALAPSA